MKPIINALSFVLATAIVLFIIGSIMFLTYTITDGIKENIILRVVLLFFIPFVVIEFIVSILDSGNNK